jgi:urea transport system permease protein
MTELLVRARRAAAIVAISCCAALPALSALALPPELVHDLALGENEEKVKAIAALVASGDAGALPLLQSLLNGEVQTAGETVFASRTALPPTSRPVPGSTRSESRDDVVLNNRVRRELATAIAALQLVATDRATRLPRRRRCSAAPTKRCCR